MPCPTPTHMVARARRRPDSVSSRAAVPAMRAPDMPSGWPSAMAPPFGFTCAASSGNPELRAGRDALAGEGLVEFDDVEIRAGAGPAARRACGSPARADAHDARRNARRGPAQDAGDRGRDHSVVAAASEATISAAAPSLTPDALPAVTVPPSLRNGVDSFASASIVVSPRGCSSLSTTTGSPLRCGIVTGTISLARRPLACAAAAFFWERSGEGVLVLPRDLELLGDVLAGLRHGIDAVLLLHQRVDEPPADGGVVDLGIAREKAVSALGMTKGARDMDSTPPAMIEVGLAGLDRAGGGDHRIHARAAEAVHGRARHGGRQARQQQRHAGDVAVVLAGLVGAAVDHVVHGLEIDPRDGVP